jgi:hypothetical protein
MAANQMLRRSATLTSQHIESICIQGWRIEIIERCLNIRCGKPLVFFHNRDLEYRVFLVLYESSLIRERVLVDDLISGHLVSCWIKLNKKRRER